MFRKWFLKAHLVMLLFPVSCFFLFLVSCFLFLIFYFTTRNYIFFNRKNHRERFCRHFLDHRQGRRESLVRKTLFRWKKVGRRYIDAKIMTSAKVSFLDAKNWFIDIGRNTLCRHHFFSIGKGLDM